jgi:hypothetical protein
VHVKGRRVLCYHGEVAENPHAHVSNVYGAIVPSTQSQPPRICKANGQPLKLACEPPYPSTPIRESFPSQLMQSQTRTTLRRP